MDWKKLITALSAVASALSGAEALLHAVGLPTQVAAASSLVFLLLTAVGRSVWPERKPAGGRGPGGTGGGFVTDDEPLLAERRDVDLWPLVALLALAATTGACTHRAQVRADTTVAKACQHAALGIALAVSVESEVCEAKGDASQACLRAEKATDTARQLALLCDPEHPAPRPVEPQRPDVGAPPPEAPKVPEAPPLALRPNRPGIPSAHLAAPRSRSGRAKDLRDCRPPCRRA